MVGGHDSAAVSQNGGKSWEQIPDLEGVDPMGWVIDPSDSSKMYVGGHLGFYRSGDAGKSWSQDNPDLPGTDVHGLGIDPQAPDTLYAYVVGAGLVRSLNAGESWEPVNTSVAVMGPILVDPRDSGTLYLSSGEVEFLTSDDGGKSWQELGAIPGGMAMWISQDRKNPEIFYAANGRVVKSTDGGRNWRPTGDGLPDSISTVAVSSSDPRVVYAAALEGSAASVYRSQDRGVTWRAQNP